MNVFVCVCVLHFLGGPLIMLAVASVESRVQNLAQQFPALTHEAFCDALADRFVEQHSALHPDATVSHEQMDEVSGKFVPFLGWPLLLTVSKG